MTEQPAPFGNTAVAEPPAPDLPVAFDDSEPADNRRKFMMLGAGLGAVLLLVAAYFLLFKGGSSPAPDAGFVAPPVVPVTSGQSGQPAATKPIVLPKHYRGHVGRDPFKPLFQPPVASTSTGSSTTSSSSSTTSSTSTTTSPTTTGTTPTVTGTGTSTGTTGTTGTGTAGGHHANGGGGTITESSTPPAYAPIWIELVSIKGRIANFVVAYSNGKSTKTVGYVNVKSPTNSLRTDFGRVFALLGVHPTFATVQFGDGTPFDLRKGFANRHYVG
jgi:hypothetical protein